MINFDAVQVGSSGPWDAKIAIVGESPGADEVTEKLPFVGGSGKLLTMLLAEVGVNRDDCYITNVVKNKPRGNNIELSEPPCYDTYWLSMLQAELKQVNPAIIVVLGGTALNALCNYNENLERVGKSELAIMTWRGSVLPCTLVPGLKVLVTTHPAAVLRQWHWRVLLLADLGKIQNELKSRSIVRKTRTFHLFPTYAQSIDYLESLVDPYSLDIEIRNGEIACVGFARNEFEGLCIPFSNQDLTHYWDEEQELGIWKAIARRLAKPVPMIGQNIPFDLFWLSLYGSVPNLNGIEDTMLMMSLVNPELNKGLDMLCSLYTNPPEPYYKDEGKVWTGRPIPDDQFFSYNLKDCTITYEVRNALWTELGELQLQDFYRNITAKLVPCVMEPMLVGLRVDTSRQIKVYDEYIKDIDRLMLEFQSVAKERMQSKGIEAVDLNPRSTQQLVNYFYNLLGCVKQYNRKSGNLTVDEQALNKLGRIYALPEIDILDEIRDKQKTASTYLNPKKLDSDARMRCSYNIAGADSGRMSSSSGPLGSGGNLQNITHGLCRSIYIPDNQMVWLEADTSQAEARIVAHIAPEPQLIALFESGMDVHKFNASIAFDVEYKDVTKPQRFVAKHLVHAADYDVQADTFANTINKKSKESGIGINMSPAIAREKLEKFHSHFTGIRIWHGKVQKALADKPILYNLFGRPHHFLDRYGPDMFRKAYNFVPQSTNADYVNIAWINFKERYPQWRVMMQVHDALIVQCRLFEIDIVKKALYECFDITIEAHGKKFKIPIEFKMTSTNWSEMKDA